jgi:hypothetical protein
MAYSHENQIDAKPIELPRIRGTAIDSSGTAIPQLYVGIFNEPEHKLLRYSQTDSNGAFVLNTNGTDWQTVNTAW